MLLHYGPIISVFLAKELELIKWQTLSVGKDTNSLPIEVLTSSRLVHWDGLEVLSLEFNFKTRLRLLTMQNVFHKSHMHIMAIKIVHIRFHICPKCDYIWDVICQLWASLNVYVLPPFLVGFAQGAKALPWPSYEVVFYYLRYRGDAIQLEFEK